MRALGLALVLLSLGLAGGVATHAVGGAGADAEIAGGPLCGAPAPDPEGAQARPSRTTITLSPRQSGVEVVPLRTTGYNYGEPLADPSPARPANPAAPER